MGPAGFAKEIGQFVLPRRAPHILRNAHPFMEHRPDQVEAAELFDDAVPDLFALHLRLEGAEHLVPDDEDAGIVAIEIARIGRMVDAVMAGRVHHCFEPAWHAIDRFGVNPELVDQRLDAVAQIDVAVKYGVCLFFQACQQWIATNNALDIGGGHLVDLTVLFKKSESNTSGVPGIGLKSTLYDLAETQVFGDLNQTAAHNLFEILVFLVTKHHEAEKLKRDAKSKRTAGIR